MSTPSISLQLVVGEAANSAVEKLLILSLWVFNGKNRILFSLTG
jgi:hypothetical protein